ncbi:DNA helicase [Phyllobacterium phragmitis]|uniref:DNA 5'-3' helicase n=1 Tax=Phyllobacterium phragmitis TaxID=2670329 RepID=A0A2S9IIT4_9HYPH|nr:DnaB-like helicase C-terminal domain-containing protein [Phyllobacterium phragmitis]PRD40434.1 DNA helicase [Phyllobacterium phragmitis]
MTGNVEQNNQPDFVPEVEREVLGALLLGGDIRKVSSFLPPDHFVVDAHRVLFEAACSAAEQYGSCRPNIVARLLPPESDALFKQRFEQSPQAYIAKLATDCVYGAPRLDKTAHAVVAQWARLKAAEEGLRLHAVASDAGNDADKLIKDVSRNLDDIASHLRIGPKRKTLITLAEATEQALAEAEDAINRGSDVTGVTWGLTDINRLTGGLHPGEMVIIGARPSMGKTAFAVSVAVRAAKSNAGVGFISLEMSSAKLAIRAATDLSYDWNIKVPYSDLIAGRASKEDLEKIKDASREVNGLPLIIEEQSGLSIPDIRVKLEIMAERCEHAGSPLKMFVVDYMQLIRPTNRYQGNKTAEVSEISFGLRNIAREYGVALLALSQLSRQVESRDDKRPQLSDLRESGSIEQDAELVAFLYREAYYLEKAKGKDPERESDRIDRLIDCQNKLEFIVAKQRNGAVKTVDLFVDIACSAVRNAVRFQ